MFILVRILLLFSALILFPFYGLFYAEYAKSYSSLLILNEDNNEDLPKMFRKSKQRISGSSQFSEQGLKIMIDQIPSEKILLIDLREESHGFFNGMAISWYGKEHNWLNVGKSKETIIQEEKKLLNKLKQKSLVWIYKHRKFPHPFFPKEIVTEEELATKYNLQYLRLNVSDHKRPSDQAVDTFVDSIKNLPENVWLHFHCSAGKGRTTTFMAMFDIMKLKDRSFDEIIRKQIDIGGINLRTLTPDKDWKHPYATERLAFLKNFYQYNQEVPNNSISWSNWLNLRKRS